MKSLAYPLLFALLLLPTAQGQDDIEIACEPPPGSVGAKLLAKQASARLARQDGKKKSADPTPTDPIIIPLPPAPTPTPTPTPTPGAPVILSMDQTYVVRAITKVRVFSSDESILSVTEDTGPIKIRGVFYPSTKRETKTFTELKVASVDPVAEGTATLLVVPLDDTIPVMRIKILVGPQPPPPPPPNPVTISISPTTATVPTKGTQQFVAAVSQGGIRWTCSGAGTVDQTGLFTAGASAGTAVIVVVSTFDPSKTVSATITVTDVPPPNPAPIPTPGFRVLMVYDKNTLNKLPPAQLGILYSADVRAYLASKCVKGPDGTMPEYRCYPADEPMDLESDLWKTAMKRDRKSLPWILISDGKTGTEQPLPANVADTLTLLKKYGGP